LALPELGKLVFHSDAVAADVPLQPVDGTVFLLLKEGACVP